MSEKNFTKLSDYFIALSNESGNLISNLQLQKLMYYAQAWHLAKFKTRLINRDFEAWVHGPVIPDVYHYYKNNGWMAIVRKDLDQQKINEFESELDAKQLELLNAVVEEYFVLPAFQLEKMTHSEDPWLIARGDLPKDAISSKVISNEDIIKYYGKFLIADGQE